MLRAPVGMADHQVARLEIPFDLGRRRPRDIVDVLGAGCGRLKVEALAMRRAPEPAALAQFPVGVQRLGGVERSCSFDEVEKPLGERAPEGRLVRVLDPAGAQERLDDGVPSPERRRATEPRGRGDADFPQAVPQADDLVKECGRRLGLVALDHDAPAIRQRYAGHRPDAHGVEQTLRHAAPERFAAEGVDRGCDPPRIVGSVDGEIDVGGLPVGALRGDDLGQAHDARSSGSVSAEISASVGVRQAMERSPR